MNDDANITRVAPSTAWDIMLSTYFRFETVDTTSLAWEACSTHRIAASRASNDISTPCTDTCTDTLEVSEIPTILPPTEEEPTIKPTVAPAGELGPPICNPQRSHILRSPVSSVLSSWTAFRECFAVILGLVASIPRALL